LFDRDVAHGDAIDHLDAARPLDQRAARPHPSHQPTGPLFQSLGDALFDTTSSPGRLLVTMLAAIAEFERELIRERTGEGRRRAMAAGVKFGRPPVLTAFQKAEAHRRRQAGEPLSLIAQAYRVSVSTIARL
jgi:DNA invertase Pin-like site-specific DNA recombinase